MSEFTANIIQKTGEITTFSSNNFFILLIDLLNRLESENNFFSGVIIDNDTGSVMHRCNKVVHQ